MFNIYSTVKNRISFENIDFNEETKDFFDDFFSLFLFSIIIPILLVYLNITNVDYSLHPIIYYFVKSFRWLWNGIFIIYLIPSLIDLMNYIISKLFEFYEFLLEKWNKLFEKQNSEEMNKFKRRIWLNEKIDFFQSITNTIDSWLINIFGMKWILYMMVNIPVVELLSLFIIIVKILIKFIF